MTSKCLQSTVEVTGKLEALLLHRKGNTVAEIQFADEIQYLVPAGNQLSNWNSRTCWYNVKVQKYCNVTYHSDWDFANIRAKRPYKSTVPWNLLECQSAVRLLSGRSNPTLTTYKYYIMTPCCDWLLMTRSQPGNDFERTTEENKTRNTMQI